MAGHLLCHFGPFIWDIFMKSSFPISQERTAESYNNSILVKNYFKGREQISARDPRAAQEWLVFLSISYLGHLTWDIIRISSYPHPKNSEVLKEVETWKGILWGKNISHRWNSEHLVCHFGHFTWEIFTEFSCPHPKTMRKPTKTGNIDEKLIWRGTVCRKSTSGAGRILVI